MEESSDTYYRLQGIDGASLPLELEYGDARCVVTDGDLALQPDPGLGGDGVICIRLFGTAFDHGQNHQIYLERFPFDRLDQAHLTFPGGWRHPLATPPHSLVRQFAYGLEVTALNDDPVRTFRPHRWAYIASQDRLPGFDAAAV